jgi:hypothetical protein
MGTWRRAAAVLPCVTSNVPCRPLIHDINSHRSRKHSSGRSPVSASTAAIVARGSRTAERYFASSVLLTTRSRRCSPGRSLIFGTLCKTPHSTARCKMLRRTRSELLAVETWSPRFKRKVANCDAVSPVIKSIGVSASRFEESKERIPVRYQSQDLLALRSNVARAQGSKRSVQKIYRFGTRVFSRMPTSPFQ